ncbi:MAG: cyclic nucleotide-binding domain-containing protein, partial [Syntrophobacteria bacterium]
MMRDFETWHLKDLLSQSKIRKYEDEEEIIKEGAEDRWFYFLLTGQVRIVKAGEELAVVKHKCSAGGLHKATARFLHSAGSP